MKVEIAPKLVFPEAIPGHLYQLNDPGHICHGSIFICITTYDPVLCLFDVSDGICFSSSDTFGGNDYEHCWEDVTNQYKLVEDQG